MIELFDLVGTDDRRFSSNCWRAQFALAHKGLPYRTLPTRFRDIRPFTGHPTIPVIRDGETVICDSARIARYLEDKYPTPSLFGAGAGRAYAAHLETWIGAALSQPMFRLIVLDLFARIDPADRAYFRETREKRFGMTFEALAAPPREDRAAAVLAALAPIRAAVAEAPFLGGATPLYPDYLVAAMLLWPRTISPEPLLMPDDPLTPWFERVLDLHGGLARCAVRVWDGP